MTLKDVSHQSLNALSARIGSLWASYDFMRGVIGKAPDSKTLTEIGKLTTRYRKAHKAYDAGDYLECIKVATDEVEEAA